MARVVEVINLFKNFQVGLQQVKVLQGISFNIEEGDFLIVFGPSGCGKSTLLHTIIGLEKPTLGSVKMMGYDLYNNTTEDDRSDIRKKFVGMVYQQPNWIKSLNVIENVAFPLILLGKEREQSIKKAGELLKNVGMYSWSYFAPYMLSSGQQQKVALCRALISNPGIIIADEPTGNLDFDSSKEIMSILNKLNTEQKRTILMVTHDLEYLRYAKNFLRMLNGKIDERVNKNKDELLFEIEKSRLM